MCRNGFSRTNGESRPDLENDLLSDLNRPGPLEAHDCPKCRVRETTSPLVRPV